MKETNNIYLDFNPYEPEIINFDGNPESFRSESFEEWYDRKFEEMNNSITNEEMLNAKGWVTIPTDLSDEEVLKMYHENERQAKKQAYHDEVCNKIENFFHNELGIYTDWLRMQMDVWAQQIVEKNWSD